MKITRTLLSSLLLLVPACDREDPGTLPESEELAAEAGGAALPLRSREAAAEPHTADAEHEKLKHGKPTPVMPEARAAFDELTGLIESKYVEGPLSEDELWTGAMEGVLARMVQLPEHQINTLLPPREHEELLIGTKGRMVGVGVMIERVANVVVIRDIIPDGPAEASGLRAGDRILGVDGERLEDLDLTAVVDKIRGEEGSTVELFVQRDTEEWTETVTRGLVKVPSVQGRMLDGVGYLRITSFSEKTPEEIDALLTGFAEEGARGVVLDLRYCPGGLLDSALETIARFVPAGKVVLTLENREGQAEPRRTEGEHPWQDKPLSVLIGPKTASGAEILADAIHEHGRGVLVGETTLGKHTVESIHELSGGWAVKISVERFATASGQTEQGVGVSPDIRIPPPDGKHELAPVRDLDAAADPALATAMGLLR